MAHPSAPPNAVRPVTDTEVAFFVQNGWVLLRGLVDPDVCRAMLEIGKPKLAAIVEGSDANDVKPGSTQMRIAENDQGTIVNIPQWCEWRGPVRAAQDPVYSGVVLSKVMGANVRRLLERDRPLRIYHDIFVCKRPDNVSTPTHFHQDATNFPLDRNALTVWMALDEVTPEQGPVRFYSGSHKGGLYGSIPPGGGDIRDEYPELERYPISPEHHLQPGDATVHHGLVVHGAGANNTPRPRWSYLASYFPADARYNGMPNHDTDGFGLRKGYAIDHPSFRMVEE
jgi:hypothetical protein